MNSAIISKKLLTMALSGILVTSISPASLATNVDAGKTSLDADEAYILFHVKDRSITSSALSLTNANSKIKLKLSDRNSMQLLKVKAGIYAASIGNNKRNKGIQVAPGTVTYIGNWTLLGAEGLRLNGKLINASKENISIRYDVDSLFDFAEQNQWVTKYPLHISNTSGKRVANNWTQTGQRS